MLISPDLLVDTFIILQVQFMTIMVELIAKVCHEAIKAFCEAYDDFSQKSWNDADEWQRQSTIKSVQYRLANPGASHSAQHDAWMADKIANGWKYGVIKNAQAKTHPCIVPYDQLPEIEKQKDALFQSIVDVLKTNLTSFSQSD